MKKAKKHSKGYFERRSHKKNQPPKVAKNFLPPFPPAPLKKAPAAGYAEGIIELKGRSGFVLSTDASIPDILVQGPSLRLASSGDRVRVQLQATAPGTRRMGEIVEVLERSRSTAVGIYGMDGKRPILIPESGDVAIRILDQNGLRPHEGELVVLKITEWPTAQKPAGGVLTEVLGKRRTPSVDLKVLIRSHELPEAFPPTVEQKATAFGSSVPAEAYASRETFFHLPVCTIDGADAKDFDDAVSIEPLPNGAWRLGVHIADVAHYVREHDALDTEALRRGTSVYLTGHVIPMLPFDLSDVLCSLRPEVVRLTLSCLMDISAEGEVTGHRIVESAIRSAKRFTYEEVDTILQGAHPDLPPELIRDVRHMGELARKLRAKRFARGSLDFDFPEPYFVLDKEGWPLDVRRRQRLESHRLIEEFMLLANETVAQHMSDVPFLYRIHETPSPEKLNNLEKTLKALGVNVPRGLHHGDPKALQTIIRAVEVSSENPRTGEQEVQQARQAMVQMLILRSLKQAVYSPRNAGHYGLASRCYTHFTSPIRRYPDLLVHRIVKERLQGSLSADRQAHWKKILPSLTEQSSRRERAAVEAEREFLDLKKVQMMREHVGETFEGVITSVTSFGIFVQFAKEFIEGLVHVSNLSDDYYIYDEVRMILRGKRSGHAFQMGQKVRVVLAQANVLKRQMDLVLDKSKSKANRREIS